MKKSRQKNKKQFQAEVKISVGRKWIHFDIAKKSLRDVGLSPAKVEEEPMGGVVPISTFFKPKKGKK